MILKCLVLRCFLPSAPGTSFHLSTLVNGVGSVVKWHYLRRTMVNGEFNLLLSIVLAHSKTFGFVFFGALTGEKDLRWANSMSRCLLMAP